MYDICIDLNQCICKHVSSIHLKIYLKHESWWISIFVFTQHVNNALARQCYETPVRDAEIPHRELFVLTSVDHWMMAKKKYAIGNLLISHACKISGNALDSIWIPICICICMNIHIYIYINIYLHIYLYIYGQITITNI